MKTTEYFNIFIILTNFILIIFKKFFNYINQKKYLFIKCLMGANQIVVYFSGAVWKE